MNIFNSLGSNYGSSEIWSAFFGTKKSDSVNNLTQYLQEKYQAEVLLTYKGREALQLAFKAAALPKDAEVAINGFTCYAVYRAITYAGYKAHYLDIDKQTLNFTAESLDKAVQKNPKLKVVIIQNTLGIMCDIMAIQKVCKQHNLLLIEDLAHSVGGQYANGVEAGTVGDMVMLSFGRDKLIDAVSGGALLVRTKKYATQLPDHLSKAPQAARFRDRLYPLLTAKIRWGYKIGIGKAVHAGFKKTGLLTRSVDAELYEGHSLTAWQSEAALRQLTKLSKEVTRRTELAKLYKKHLPNLIELQNSTNLRVPVQVEGREKLLEQLSQQGVRITDTWYDAPIAPPRFLKSTTYTNQCPISEGVTKQMINLPTHKHVKPKDVVKICEIISEWQSK